MFSFSKGQQTGRRRNSESPEQESPAPPKQQAPLVVPPVVKAAPDKKRTLILGTPSRPDVEKAISLENASSDMRDKRPVDQPDHLSPTDLEEPASLPGTTSPAADLVEPSSRLPEEQLVDRQSTLPPVDLNDEPLLDDVGVEKETERELEDFRAADIYESLDDIDDLDAFEEAQLQKGAGPAPHAGPQVERATSPIDRAERPLLPSEQARLSLREAEEQDPSKPHVAALAASLLPSAPTRPSETPEAGFRRDKAETGLANTQGETSLGKAAAQPAFQTTEDRRPPIDAVHGAKLSSLLKIPTGDEETTADTARPIAPKDDALPRKSSPPDTPRPVLPSAASSQRDIEVEPNSPRKRRRQPAVNIGFLPTLMIAEIPRLRRFAAAMIGDEGTADHLVQETLQQALAEQGELRLDRELYVSLLMILYRLRSDVVKQLDKTQQPTMTRSFSDVLFQRLQGADVEEVREFADAIGKLGEEDRALLLLIGLENLDYRDIATVIKVPAGRVMTKIARAREHLSFALSASADQADRSPIAGDQG